MRRVLWAVPVVAAVVLLFYVGFGHNPDAAPSPLLGRRAPDFRLTIAGDPRQINLHSLRGTPVVLNFFASWCVSCREQESNLVSEARKWHRQIRFLGIVFEDSASAALAFTRGHGGHWPDLVDPGGSVAVDYGVTGVPETFFINRAGRIASHSVSLSPDALKSGVTAALHG